MSVELYTKDDKFLGQLATNKGYFDFLKAVIGPESGKLQSTGRHDNPKALLEEIQGYLGDEIEKSATESDRDFIHVLANLVNLLKKAGNDPIKVIM